MTGERNGIARDSYSYLHFPMLAGSALIAVGLKITIANVNEPLEIVPATALLGRAFAPHQVLIGAEDSDAGRSRPERYRWIAGPDDHVSKIHQGAFTCPAEH